ncbi:hypothetical protein CK216_25355 [Mesorhizobium sp. WSM3876]|nr:hypothetical protein CK216_25355 [Mesorhizobium sp. WSM3876]
MFSRSLLTGANRRLPCLVADRPGGRSPRRRPIAGLSVRSGNYRLKHYARREAQVVVGKVSLLQAPLGVPWGMPVVLTVERR